MVRGQGAEIGRRYAWLGARWVGVLLAVAALPGWCDDMRERYARAESLLAWNVKGKLPGFEVEPVWLDQDRFWYRSGNDSRNGFVLVNAARNTQAPLFDHDVLAAALSGLLGKTYSPSNLPFRTLGIDRESGEIRVRVDGRSIACMETTASCRMAGEKAVDAAREVVSPDGKWAAFVRDHDLYVRSVETDAVRRLTDDGVAGHAYAVWPDGHVGKFHMQRMGAPRLPGVLWSPDSRRLLTYRVDERQVPELPMLQMVPPEGYGGRPILHKMRVPMPGDQEVTTSALVVFEAETGKRVDIQDAPLISYYNLLHVFAGYLSWSPDSRKVYYFQHARGYREVSLSVADADTGQARVLVVERADKFIWEKVPTVSASGKEVFWLSSRDGWQHLYRHNGETGALLGQLTTGDWRVDAVLHVDESNRWVYFTAGGREPGLDPYYLQLYRVRFDGTGIQRLTPEARHHAIRFAPGGDYFVDQYSTVDRAPIAVLRRADGRLVRQLEEVDLSPLVARGWRPPERFKAKGRDGVTDIYGAMFFPADFDPAKTYPVIDYIYGGPQAIWAAYSFGINTVESTSNALAQLGFIVVRIDGMGTPGRSRAFHEVSYAEGFREGGGIVDHIAALRDIARQRPYLDLDRVGIFGLSGGGYGTARAMFDHGDFYKVGVSAAGSHDQRLYLAEWGEHFIGRPEWSPQAYVTQANLHAVEGLQGKLMLAHGTMDDDVHIVNSMQLAHALIAANKDFDLLILPDRLHNLYGDTYFLRKMWDYFVEHLQGSRAPKGYRIGEPPGS